MKRLDVICSLIDRVETLADVGCDHGLVSKFVLDNGLAQRVYATDISEGSLGKARQLLSGYEGVSFLQGDGLKPLNQAGVDVQLAVICGMGGQTIMKILSEARRVPTLLLGAQKNANLLRRYLIENGYQITQDVMVEDKGKFYDVIKASQGSDSLTPLQERFGKFYTTKNADMLLYLNWLSARLEGYKQTKENVSLAQQIVEVMKWQR